MSLVKSLLIPTALALSLVATESRAEVQTFQATEVRLTKFTATNICKEFQAGRGSHYDYMKLRVRQWKQFMSATYPGTMFGQESRETSVRKVTTTKFRCLMIWRVKYTRPS